MGRPQGQATRALETTAEPGLDPGCCRCVLGGFKQGTALLQGAPSGCRCEGQVQALEGRVGR